MNIELIYTKVGGYCVPDFCIDSAPNIDYNVLVH